MNISSMDVIKTIRLTDICASILSLQNIFGRILDIRRPELEELVDHNIIYSSHIFSYHLFPIGAFWLLVCSARTRFFWSKGDLSYSQVQKYVHIILPHSCSNAYKSLDFLNQVHGPISSLDRGCDQSDCHHSGNSSRGRGEPN